MHRHIHWSGHLFSPRRTDLRDIGGNLKDLLFKLYVKFQNLKDREEGQDLVEYALVVALIAFGATAGMGALAGGINSAFNTISSTLGTSI
jgi:pilus assembly protein Flp/PilA